MQLNPNINCRKGPFLFIVPLLQNKHVAQTKQMSIFPNLLFSILIKSKEIIGSIMNIRSGKSEKELAQKLQTKEDGGGSRGGGRGRRYGCIRTLPRRGSSRRKF
ncbi:hypothetical protein NE237_009016 [Protea cynaroides]|uniref:Uncharacterized protein n=1 Tax=Protea cynaroides TaxID=273540 RepID=A0A9Q0KWZ8_9MAGN|nr:hypothetical protein NE237_009016 [Protea cynaroides]